MSNLHDPEGMPLTLYRYDDNDWSKIYVANTELEKKYPIIAKVVQYDDIAATDDTDIVRFHVCFPLLIILRE